MGIRHLSIIVMMTLCLGLLTGCRHKYDARLTHAEAIMADYPDSAMSIIESVDSATLRGDADRALYAMLLTMAQTKCHINPTDDSLISVAVAFYRTHNDPHRSAISSFYQGCVYFFRDSLSAALVSYLRAKDIAERHNDPFWAGLACRGISEVYQELGNYGAQLTYARKQKDYMIKEGKQPYLNYALADYACALHNTFQPDSALAIYAQTIDSALYSSDSNLYYMTLRMKSQCLMGEERYNDAYPLLEEIWDAGVALPMDSLNLAWCMAAMGNVTDAVGMLDTVRGDGRPVKYSVRSRYFREKGDYKNAVIELDRLDSVITRTVKSSVAHNMSDHMEAYYEMSRQLDQSRLRESRMRF